jgi:hypothetical protein
MAGAPSAFAQYQSESEATIPLDKFYIARKGSGRKLLSKITFGLSTGIGSTTFKHKLDGFGILQNPNEAVRVYNSGDETSGYSNWFNRIDTITNTLEPGRFSVNSDTSEIGFRAKAWSIPIKATLHYEFLQRYRIGGGYSIEYMNIGNFYATNYGDRINSFSPGESSFFLKKYFGMLGASVYRYDQYLLVVDVNIGGYKLGKEFQGSIKKGMYYNFGVAIEREMSEYFRLFIRPSYEFKSYTISVPEGGSSIKHRFNAFYFNFGATYRFPELRRCPIKGCHGQLNHAHGNREYRSRRHPIWKKQNPHYGENYPELIKYKGKNKRKLNPY